MNGLSAMKRTASTSSSIFAVSSAMVLRSGISLAAVISFALARVDRLSTAIQLVTTFHSMVSPPR